MSLPPQIVDLNSIDELGPTFVGLQLMQLSDIIDFQGNEAFKAAGLGMPSRSTSTLLFIRNNAPVSITDIASFFGISHQLASQRLKSLKTHKLVTAKCDPNDSRRTLLSLTASGRTVSRQVEALCHDLEQVIRGLFEEIDVDLFDALIRAKSALARSGLLERRE